MHLCLWLIISSISEHSHNRCLLWHRKLMIQTVTRAWQTIWLAYTINYVANYYVAKIGRNPAGNGTSFKTVVVKADFQHMWPGGTHYIDTLFKQKTNWQMAGTCFVASTHQTWNQNDCKPLSSTWIRRPNTLTRPLMTLKTTRQYPTKSKSLDLIQKNWAWSLRCPFLSLFSS